MYHFGCIMKVCSLVPAALCASQSQAERCVLRELQQHSLVVCAATSFLICVAYCKQCVLAPDTIVGQSQWVFLVLVSVAPV